MILAEEVISFLASKKKIEFLRKVENQKTDDTGVPPVKLFVRDRVRIKLLDYFCRCCRYISTLDTNVSGYLFKE